MFLLSTHLHPDVYCDLWNIAECEAVIPDDLTVEELKPSIPVSSSSPTVDQQNSSTSQHVLNPPSRITTTRIGGLIQRRSLSTSRLQITNEQMQTPQFSTPSRIVGFVGVLLKFHDPPSTRCIRTSTRELAKLLSDLINEKLA